MTDSSPNTQASTSCGDECGCDQHADSNSRRTFLQRAATVTLGAISLTYLPVIMKQDGVAASNGDGGDSPDGKEGSDQEVLFGFIVDTERCIGAGKCLTACRVENKVPEGFYRTWVERYVHFKDGTVRVDMVPETSFFDSELTPIDPEKVARSYFVPKLCNQCEDAPCNQVCPTHASITSPEGVELVDPNLCIGCAYCVQACPYGVRFINPDTGNADKCDWCYHRVTNGEQPACVEACPVDARVFGRLDDPNSEISKRLAKVPTTVLKQHLGTHPKLHYIGNSGEVI